jgi:hypothetical protein
MSEVGRLIGHTVEAFDKGKVKGDKFVIDLDDAKLIYNTIRGMGCDCENEDLVWGEED